MIRYAFGAAAQDALWRWRPIAPRPAISTQHPGLCCLGPATQDDWTFGGPHVDAAAEKISHLTHLKHLTVGYCWASHLPHSFMARLPITLQVGRAAVLVTIGMYIPHGRVPVLSDCCACCMLHAANDVDAACDDSLPSAFCSVAATASACQLRRQAHGISCDSC